MAVLFLSSSRVPARPRPPVSPAAAAPEKLKSDPSLSFGVSGFFDSVCLRRRPCASSVLSACQSVSQSVSQSVGSRFLMHLLLLK